MNASSRTGHHSGSDWMVLLPCLPCRGTAGSHLQPRDPRSGLRCYLLLKYLQVLMLPEASESVLLVGALASAHAAVLLSSPRISWKASNVLLGQLALTDVLLPLRWGLAALGMWWGDEVAGALAQGLLGAQRQASSLLLSCLSLEVVLMRWRAEGTRRLRTAHHARTLSAAVWALTLGKLLLLQAVGHSPLPVQGAALKACLLAASVLRSFTRCLKGALWLADTWVYYTIFCNSTQCRKSCLR